MGGREGGEGGRGREGDEVEEGEKVAGKGRGGKALRGGMRDHLNTAHSMFLLVLCPPVALFRTCWLW
jgi:hypothetical protein